MKNETFLFLVIISIIEVVHFFERKDLYNRIMAKDLTEYQKDKKPVGKVENLIKKNMRKNMFGGGSDEG